MKEQTLIQLKNKVEQLEITMQQVIQEMYNLKNLLIVTGKLNKSFLKCDNE